MIEHLKLDFHQGLNVLIGENNTGKTAILDALRICFGIGAERRELYVSRDDFHVGASGDAVREIEFHLAFAGLEEHEAGVFYELLGVSDDGEPEPQLHYRFTYDEDRDWIRFEYWGGEKEGQRIPQELQALIYFVHLGALRDANRDLSPRRANRLSKLFLKLVPETKKQRELASQLSDAVHGLGSWKELMRTAKDKINEHLGEVTLRTNPQTVDVDFVQTGFRRIVEDLKMHLPRARTDGHDEDGGPLVADTEYRFEIRQNGLGYNNLIYAATVFGDLIERRQRQKDSYIALLIE